MLLRHPAGRRCVTVVINLHYYSRLRSESRQSRNQVRVGDTESEEGSSNVPKFRPRTERCDLPPSLPPSQRAVRNKPQLATPGSSSSSSSRRWRRPPPNCDHIPHIAAPALRWRRRRTVMRSRLLRDLSRPRYTAFTPPRASFRAVTMEGRNF